MSKHVERGIAAEHVENTMFNDNTKSSQAQPTFMASSAAVPKSNDGTKGKAPKANDTSNKTNGVMDSLTTETKVSFLERCGTQDLLNRIGSYCEIVFSRKAAFSHDLQQYIESLRDDMRLSIAAKDINDNREVTYFVQNVLQMQMNSSGQYTFGQRYPSLSKIAEIEYCVNIMKNFDLNNGVDSLISEVTDEEKIFKHEKIAFLKYVGDKTERTKTFLECLFILSFEKGVGAVEAMIKKMQGNKMQLTGVSVDPNDMVASLILEYLGFEQCNAESQHQTSGQAGTGPLQYKRDTFPSSVDVDMCYDALNAVVRWFGPMVCSSDAYFKAVHLGNGERAAKIFENCTELVKNLENGVTGDTIECKDTNGVKLFELFGYAQDNKKLGSYRKIIKLNEQQARSAIFIATQVGQSAVHQLFHKVDLNKDEDALKRLYKFIKQRKGFKCSVLSKNCYFVKILSLCGYANVGGDKFDVFDVNDSIVNFTVAKLERFQFIKEMIAPKQAQPKGMGKSKVAHKNQRASSSKNPPVESKLNLKECGKAINKLQTLPHPNKLLLCIKFVPHRIKSNLQGNKKIDISNNAQYLTPKIMKFFKSLGYEYDFERKLMILESVPPPKFLDIVDNMVLLAIGNVQTVMKNVDQTKLYGNSDLYDYDFLFDLDLAELATQAVAQESNVEMSVDGDGVMNKNDVHESGVKPSGVKAVEEEEGPKNKLSGFDIASIYPKPLSGRDSTKLDTETPRQGQELSDYGEDYPDYDSADDFDNYMNRKNNNNNNGEEDDGYVNGGCDEDEDDDNDDNDDNDEQNEQVEGDTQTNTILDESVSMQDAYSQM